MNVHHIFLLLAVQTYYTNALMKKGRIMSDYFIKRAAWRYQINTARRRGITFQLTFEEWVKWWQSNLGDDWFNKRGKTHGKYVMARKGDKGPYRLDNIKCILAVENSREWDRPPGHGGKISPVVAAKIFEADGCMAAISQKYKTGYHSVYDIRNRRSWKKLTKELRRGKDCPCANGVPCELGFSRLAVTL